MDRLLAKSAKIKVYGLPSCTEVRTALTINTQKQIIKTEERKDIKKTEDPDKSEGSKSRIPGSSSSSKNALSSNSKSSRERNKDREKEKEKVKEREKEEIKEKEKEKEKIALLNHTIPVISPISEALRKSLCINLRGLVKRVKPSMGSVITVHALTLMHRYCNFLSLIT